MIVDSILHLWISGSAPVAQSVMPGVITVQTCRVVKTQND